MSAFHHLIIATTDPTRTADYFSALLGTADPFTDGFFRTIVLGDEVVLNFAGAPAELSPQHYAFLVDNAHFDRVLARFHEEGTEYWADPPRTRPGELGAVDGSPNGRRMYFVGPDGHLKPVRQCTVAVRRPEDGGVAAPPPAGFIHLGCGVAALSALPTDCWLRHYAAEGADRTRAVSKPRAATSRYSLYVPGPARRVTHNSTWSAATSC